MFDDLSEAYIIGQKQTLELSKQTYRHPVDINWTDHV